MAIRFSYKGQGYTMPDGGGYVRTDHDGQQVFLTPSKHIRQTNPGVLGVALECKTAEEAISELQEEEQLGEVEC